MTDWTKFNYAVVDVEGNGQQPPDLVELAVVPIRRGVVGEPLTWLVKPRRPITYFARKVHGIDNSALAEAPEIEEVKHSILAALEAHALVAHNAHVDVSVLQRELRDMAHVEVFDTLKLARRLMPGLSSYRLQLLVDWLGLAQDLSDQLQPHRATYDALVTARLFVRLANPANAPSLTIEQLRSPTTGISDAASTLF